MIIRFSMKRALICGLILIIHEDILTGRPDFLIYRRFPFYVRFGGKSDTAASPGEIQSRVECIPYRKFMAVMTNAVSTQRSS